MMIKIKCNFHAERKIEMDWYEENIEQGIRPLVRLLRDNGFNTYDSCEDSMHVSCELYDSSQIDELYNLLKSNNYQKFKISETYYQNSLGQLIKELTVNLPMKDGFFCST